mmetsp:Transcript_1518/g.3136  ORF Transcript_1518/g.3136 Transcript_1518/m.3136 type:complete len:95 (+) Transcript_1518:525-809(+)
MLGMLYSHICKFCCGIRPKNLAERDADMESLDSERVEREMQDTLRKENPSIPSAEIGKACEAARRENEDPYLKEQRQEEEQKVNATRLGRYRKR